MLEQFIKYLSDEAENHSIYVWGAQGQRGKEITEQWIRKCENSEKNADRAVAFWKKQTKAGYEDKLGAFDCSGLGVYWLLKNKLISGDKTANGLRGLTRQITRREVKRGDWLFEVKEGRATHIGYAVSTLQAVECRGRDWGVCITDIDKRNWNAFGRPEMFASEIESMEVQLSGPLKHGDKGPDVATVQRALIAKGFALNKYGADGCFGSETKTAVQSLQKSLNSDPSGTVSRVEAEALGIVWCGSDDPADYETQYHILAEKYQSLRQSYDEVNTLYNKALSDIKNADKLLKSTVSCIKEYSDCG